MNGPAAAIAIRATASSEIPVIGIDGEKSEISKAKCLKAGMNDFVEKPCEPEIIERILRKWSGD
jgi:CheY-like chemotaxis protein